MRQSIVNPAAKTKSNMLTSEERSRYSRHLLLPQIGAKGQEKLKRSSVLVVGAGGLGSGSLMYMAAAGIGKIGIVEYDDVDASNLHRQILYGTDDVGTPKLEAAKKRLQQINPLVEIELFETRLTSENALEIVAEFDIVADGTDNFATRYLVNDACVLTKTPNVFASIFRFDGQLSIFSANGGPCYRCLFPQPPPRGAVPSCAEGGVLGVLPGILGTLQATEVIKYLAGIGEPLIGKMLMIDALSMEFRSLKFSRDPDCAVCGEIPSVTSLIDYESFCQGFREEGSGNEAVSLGAIPSTSSNHSFTDSSVLFSSNSSSIDVSELKKMRDQNEEFLLLDVRQPQEKEIADIGGTLVPMDDLEDELQTVAPDKNYKIVVMCRSGVRSASVVAWMERIGYSNTYSLDGGICAWSKQIDSSIPIY